MSRAAVNVAGEDIDGSASKKTDSRRANSSWDKEGKNSSDNDIQAATKKAGKQHSMSLSEVEELLGCSFPVILAGPVNHLQIKCRIVQIKDEAPMPMKAADSVQSNFHRHRERS